VDEEPKESKADARLRIAREEEADLEKRRVFLTKLSLLNFVPELSPEFQSPTHLWDYCAELEECGQGKRVRVICEATVRHFKTETTLHAIARMMCIDPTIRIILFTYDHERAEYLGRRTRQLCEAAGCGAARGFDKIVVWQNRWNGGVMVMSAKQSKLGQDCDVLLFDDPIDEHDAFDQKVRDSVDVAIAHYTMRCGRPGRPGDVVGIMSRWHPDDPAGRRFSREASFWKKIHHEAIVDEGLPSEHAWAPNVMPLEDIKRRRAEMKEADPGERYWYGQWQNNPLPDALGLFGTPVTYEIAPEFGRYVFGLDLAYSDIGGADYFALVVIKIWEGIASVVDVMREHRDLYAAAHRIKFAQRMYPSAAIYSYVAGPEKGAVRYLNDRGINVQPMLARYDKQTRARHTIDAWNAGRIRVPTQSSWVGGFVVRAKMFTGHPKAANDDEIDALVSACDGGLFSSVTAPKSFGKPRI
jgi:hypothetical protein